MTDRPAKAPPGQPRDHEGPVFKEPWEAQAFALTLELHEAGPRDAKRGAPPVRPVLLSRSETA
jgi:hypothetical protein